MDKIQTILIGFVMMIILFTSFSIIAPMIGTAGDKLGDTEQRCNDQSGCTYNTSLSDSDTDIDLLTNVNNATIKNLQYKAQGTTCFITRVNDINLTSNLTSASYTLNNCTIVPKNATYNGNNWNVTYIYAKAGGSEPCRNSASPQLACSSGEPYTPPFGSMFGNSGIVMLIICAGFFILIITALLKRR